MTTSKLLLRSLLALSLPVVAHAATESADQQELQKAFFTVRHQVGQHWEVPADARPAQQATLAVEVSPNGAFEAATVTSSSGDRQFDRSAIKAISKALPIPEWRSLSTRTRERLARFTLNLGPRGNNSSSHHSEANQ